MDPRKIQEEKLQESWILRHCGVETEVVTEEEDTEADTEAEETEADTEEEETEKKMEIEKSELNQSMQATSSVNQHQNPSES